MTSTQMQHLSSPQWFYLMFHCYYRKVFEDEDSNIVLMSGLIWQSSGMKMVK